MKNFRPLILFVIFVFIIGLACNAMSSGGDTPSQPQPQQQEPVQVEPTSEPTQEPTQPAPEPTNPPTPEPTDPPAVEKYFTEEFDQDPGDNWTTDIIGPGAEANKDSVVVNFSNSRMHVELPKEDLYYYYTYLGESYDNVRLDLRADNRGVNTNNISLFCRLSDAGWYEWSVGSGGDWYLWAVTENYNLITNGGVNFLKQGKEVNEYSMVCKDKTISMFVNGQEIKQSPVTDNKYGLREGTVGFNISSLNIVPVIVEVDWFKVSEP